MSAEDMAKIGSVLPRIAKAVILGCGTKDFNIMQNNGKRAGQVRKDVPNAPLKFFTTEHVNRWFSMSTTILFHDTPLKESYLESQTLYLSLNWQRKKWSLCNPASSHTFKCEDSLVLALNHRK
jgi:hypothetical protein